MKVRTIRIVGLMGLLFLVNVTRGEDALYEGFRDPPAQARPFVRWWWNGNCITEKEILRELDLLKAAGIGGVEINPIAMHERADTQSIQPVSWLSDEWNRLAKVAVDGAHQRGMIADMIVGSGWPFGGQFLSPEKTIKGIRLKKITLEGPRDATLLPADLKITERGRFQVQEIPEECVFIRLIPEPLDDLNRCLDFTSHLDARGGLKCHVPPGKHTLVAGWLQRRFREVMHGAPGADGPVLDHYNRQAVETYLNRMSDTLGPVLGGTLGPAVRALFCDSIELSGANWTTDLAQEFKRRRGYDLDPYLPFVLDAKLPAGSAAVLDRLKRVRYDFSKTLVELYHERFVYPYHQWCHRNKTLSRYQSYGHPWLMGMLDGYLIPDIPEGDTWLYNNWQGLDEIRFAVWNKYASSGGHLANRSLIGCEAVTNTSGVFRATLAYIKQACDLSYITGVNHLILHGFNYSPPEIPFPGWIRYGTYLNENNPWWPYFRLWADYSARLSHVLQQSRAQIDIAILGPEADIWSEHGLDRGPFVHQPDYLHYLWQAIHQNGCSADYISETILRDGHVNQGALQFGPMTYDTLILANVTTLQVESARTILRFVERGGKLICIDTIPTRSPALINAADNDAQVQDLFNRIMSHRGRNVYQVGAPQIKTITSWAQRTLNEVQVERAVTIEPPNPRLFQIHHKHEDRDIFFFVNMYQDRFSSFRATFAVDGATPWRWDPETGERSVYDISGTIRLAPLESLLLVFEDQSGLVPPKHRIDEARFQEIEGPWTLECQPVQGDPWKETVPNLFDLGHSSDQRFSTFGGTLVYKVDFETQDDWHVLDLGKVYGLAQVTLNGHDVGTRWWGPPRYDPGKALRQGCNHLEIRMPTVLANYCRSLQDNPMAHVWTQKQQHNESIGLLGPVRLYRIQTE